MNDARVLLLNCNYTPLNICGVRRAIVLLDRGKAELLENGRGELRSPTTVFTIPSVIRLIYSVKRPVFGRRLSRREAFLRDRYTCQYCGSAARELTLDHVVPRHKGGLHSWENVVSACTVCNHRKAGRTPQEANMRLLREPKAPRPNPYHMFHSRHIRDEWRKFIPWVE
ncbi:MAG: HNH endonuclease [Chloroflexi bacterium]|nr:HNH endonuclease [Chloroflexota bacterium]